MIEAYRGGTGMAASRIYSANTLPVRTRLGRLPAVYSGKGRHCGCFWTFRTSTRPTTWPKEHTDSACCGANGAKRPVVRRAIAGWNGCCRCGTPAASGVNQHFPCSSKQWHAYSKARSLISAGSLITSLSQRALPCDQLRTRVKQNVLPCLWPADSTQMRPPCISMMRLTKARPIPVPSPSASSRSKRPKIFS